MNSHIRAVIIEDDIESLNYLSSIIDKSFDELKICGYAKTVNEGIKLINNFKPEIVFMDIELEDGTAFEILDNIESPDFEVIFTTAYNDYFEKALEHFAFCYLLKPIDDKKLRKVIDRYTNVKNRLFSLSKYALYQEFIRDKDARLLIHAGNNHIAVNLSDIIYCEADGNYTIFKLCGNKNVLASNTLKYYEELLNHKAFFRANRFTLINVRHISNIFKRETIVLSNKSKINVSVRNKSKLSELISELS